MVKFFSRTSSPLSLESVVSSPPSTPPKTCLHSPLRRERLRHGAPPFFEGWANVRVLPARKAHLRYCTLSGPYLRYSATPGHPILGGCITVYGAQVASEEFPTVRISLKTSQARLYIYAESRQDHVHFFQQLLSASNRSLTSVYKFRNDLRDSGLGRCSAAVDLHTGLSVCVKVTTKAKRSASQVAQAMNEAVTLLCMPDHPNIVPIVDVYESARTLYLVTDYADANTLTEVVQYRGMLCEADVATIVSGLLRALVHMQHSQLVHRLICPDNILLLPHHDNIAVPVLHNFEYAVSNADLKDSTSMSKCYSENGPLSLSQLAYIAPEVARGDVGDSQQDVWSVGILMHFLLVGCTPFDDNLSSLDNLTRTIASTRGKPTFSGALWGGVTSGAKNLCASLLHSNAKYRVSASDALLHPWLSL
ncbi:serine:threonine protein kinase Chk2 [Gracilaria domingensis]|nr:serine:threonine protein kinase Chk2 [Gracilaria domingensis]